MTTRLNLRNISRKNITVEIIPRNNGSVNFRGAAPTNAIQENGAMKLTLSTNKIDRLGFMYPENIPMGDLILEHVGDQEVNRALVAWGDAYWGDNGSNFAQTYSLAQLGIGYAYSNGLTTPDGEKTNGAYTALYNNTDQPLVLRGSVDLDGAYFGGEVPPIELMSLESNGSMIDYESNGSMIDYESDGSMIDYESDGSMIIMDGEEEGSPQENYLNIDAKSHNVLIQDPDLNNPTFAQEKGKWGVVLGALHHRAGTSVDWAVTFPPMESEVLEVILYLPYTHIDRFGREYHGQSVAIVSRDSVDSSWWDNDGQYRIARNLARGIYNAEGGISADRYSDETEYCLMGGSDAWDPYQGEPPIGYGVYYNYPEVLPTWDPDLPTMPYTDYEFNYDDGIHNDDGQNMSLVISGLRYVGLNKDGNNVDGTSEEDGFNRDYYEDRNINQMAASKLILHPNEPFYNTLGLEIPEGYEDKVVFINAARNTHDRDNLGFVAINDNLKDFMVRSSGYNTSEQFYDANGDYANIDGEGEYNAPMEVY